MNDQAISISEFDYPLNKNRIAIHPVSPRDSSKLLVYQQGKISDHAFGDLFDHLPENSALFLNDSKVINARLYFRKKSGARIEILLLEPVEPNETVQAMSAQASCTWKCIVGNLKKWKDDVLTIESQSSLLRVKLVDRKNQWVKLSWSSKEIFAGVLNDFGNIPLPPYLNREAEERDKDDYQTIYSRSAGAVAAPTAGLHFSESMLRQLNSKGIETHYLTLHVGAGTFKPVEVENIKEHPIHGEEIIITKDTIEKLIRSKTTIAVGTTSMRMLESIYWLGVQLHNNNKHELIRKETPYQLPSIPRKDSLELVANYLEQKKRSMLSVKTELFIYPGYTFKLSNGLLTNFHLPKSSLVMLVAAFIGSDWKSVYQHALDNKYRFLSYGDSSLLVPR